MPPVKDLKRSIEKWKRQSAAAVPEYEAGIKDPRTDWAQATIAAESNYESGVNAAIARKAFGKGVSRAGTDAWRIGALTKGKARWAQGIALSGNKYAEGFAPYRTVLEGLTLSPRGPKGSPENITRVSEVTEALHAEKLRIQAQG